ncbi:Multiple sugar transport system permease protein OS=Streptomyces violarus OX=67380 GN=FHS41_000333 PE=3 SV=1 [Streptomyces violarus]
MVNDPIFWDSLAVTVEYVVIIGVQTVAALAIAVLPHRLVLLRGIVLTPYLMSTGPGWLRSSTPSRHRTRSSAPSAADCIPFLADEQVIPTIALINVWRHVGYTAPLLFAGLQAIPNDMYEVRGWTARASGGCSGGSPCPPLVLAVVLIMTVIGSFQVFDTVAVTTAWSRRTRPTRPVLHRRSAFDSFQFGYASAMSVALLVVLSAITILQ